jgi:hypothetical protein
MCVALVCPVDASGKFTDEVKDWAGVYVKVTTTRMDHLHSIK